MKIRFTRSGGFAGIRLALTLDSSELSPKDRQAVEQLLREADFYRLPPSSLSPPAQPDTFQYQISIEGEGRSHQVRVGGQGAPESLRPLLERLEEIARARALSQKQPKRSVGPGGKKPGAARNARRRGKA